MEGTGLQGRTRIVIVEDEGLFRDMLRIVLSQHPSLEVVGAFADGETALAAVPTLAPQVAMLDIELGRGINGVELGLLLRRELPDLGVVLLSNYTDPSFLSAVVPAPALGGWSYLLKRSVSDVHTLLRGIEGAAAGLVVFDPRLVEDMRGKDEGFAARLTARQQEILDLIAQGFSNTAIAERLTLSLSSVEKEISVLYQEPGVGDSSAVHPRVKLVLTYLERQPPRRPRLRAT